MINLDEFDNMTMLEVACIVTIFGPCGAYVVYSVYLLFERIYYI